MDDIFKSKDEVEREKKISNLFKSAESIENLKEPEEIIAPESEKLIVEPEKKSRKVLGRILGLLLFLILAITAGYFFWQYEKILKTYPTVAVIDEAEAIVEKIKASTELPSEKPALATITEQEKIARQPFFASALNGDKILLYIQSQKVILYRPSSNEVIGVASLFSESAPETQARIAATCATQNTPEPGEKIASSVRVDVLNGTELKGLAKETAAKLSGMENVELAKIGNAQKSTYTQILVVDVSGKNATAAEIIAQKLGGKTGELPEGESKGTADILVIAGK